MEQPHEQKLYDISDFEDDDEYLPDRLQDMSITSSTTSSECEDSASSTGDASMEVYEGNGSGQEGDLIIVVCSGYTVFYNELLYYYTI